MLTAVLDNTLAEKSLKEAMGQVDMGFILIAGPTCSGKTELSHILENYFWARENSVTIIREDDYRKDLQYIPRNEKGRLTDSKNAFYTKEMVEDFKKYLKNGRAEIPIYDDSARQRIAAKQYILKSNITIIEGLHVISLFYDLIDAMSIYLNTPIEECLSRKIRRDSISRHISREQVEKHFECCIMPSYRKDILPQSRYHGVILHSFDT